MTTREITNKYKLKLFTNKKLKSIASGNTNEKEFEFLNTMCKFYEMFVSFDEMKITDSDLYSNLKYKNNNEEKFKNKCFCF